MCVCLYLGNSLEKAFSARNGTLLDAGQEEKLGGGGCKVKSAEPARVKGPRNSAELSLIAQYDGVVGPLAFKPPQSSSRRILFQLAPPRQKYYEMQMY